MAWREPPGDVRYEEPRHAQILIDEIRAEQHRHSAKRRRINCMAQDRPDLCVVANVLSGSMAKPRVGGEALVKMVCRYLRWHPACAHCQSRQAVENEVNVLIDSDSGGDKSTRRSTSGLVVQMGDRARDFRSLWRLVRRGGTLRLKWPASRRRCTESGEVKLEANLSSWCESSAVRGYVQRAGAGRVKHLEVKSLWVEDLVSRRGPSIWVPRRLERERGEERFGELFLHAL